MNRRILGGIAGLVFVLNTNFCNTQNTQPAVYQGWPVRHQGRNSAGDFIDHRIREGDYPMVREYKKKIIHKGEKPWTVGITILGYVPRRSSATDRPIQLYFGPEAEVFRPEFRNKIFKTYIEFCGGCHVITNHGNYHKP